MTFRPGSAVPAARYVCMLASAADRDRMVRVLQESFVEGRLDKDEFEQRVAQAMLSRDFRELLVLIADLPSPRAPGISDRHRPAGRRRIAGRSDDSRFAFSLPSAFRRG
jgi:DUF1707 SHOCT-like domain